MLRIEKIVATTGDLLENHMNLFLQEGTEQQIKPQK